MLCPFDSYDSFFNGIILAALSGGRLIFIFSQTPLFWIASPFSEEAFFYLFSKSFSRSRIRYRFTFPLATLYTGMIPAEILLYKVGFFIPKKLQACSVVIKSCSSLLSIFTLLVELKKTEKVLWFNQEISVYYCHNSIGPHKRFKRDSFTSCHSKVHLRDDYEWMSGR